MIIPASVKCNGCGKSRADDSNHWRSMGSSVTNFEMRVGVVENWPYHSCGDSCTLKLVSRWLATGKLEE